MATRTTPYESWITYALSQSDRPLTVDEISASVRATHKRVIAPAQIRAYLGMNSVFRPANDKWYITGSKAERAVQQTHRARESSPYTFDDLPPPEVVAEGEYDHGTAVIGGSSTDADAIRRVVEALRAKGVADVLFLAGHRAGDLGARLFAGDALRTMSVDAPAVGLEYRRNLKNTYRSALKNASCVCLVGSEPTFEEVSLVSLAEALDIPCHLQK